MNLITDRKSRVKKIKALSESAIFSPSGALILDNPQEHSFHTLFNKLDRKRLKEISFIRRDFSHTILFECCFTECEFVECDFTSTVFKECQFADCTFADCIGR